MSIERNDQGDEWYPQPEPLTTIEKTWLFDLLWNKLRGPIALNFTDGRGNLHCIVCGSPDGCCTNVGCIRTRITNKLHLHA